MAPYGIFPKRPPKFNFVLLIRQLVCIKQNNWLEKKTK